MASPPRFYPYHPLRFRLMFLGAALLCAGITGWALYNSVNGSESLAEARGGISAGLMFACFYVFLRLRPKAGWGVETEPLRIVISKPFRGEPTRILWSEVSQVLRGGKKRNHLLLFLENGGRIILPGHLFAKREDFEALYAFAIDKVPPPKLDA